MTINYIKRKFKIIVDEDQEARKAKNEARMIEVDTRNTGFLKKVVEEHGWPTISKFGRKASERAWLLAQHADLQPQLQKIWLEMMFECKHDVDPWNIAYLTDRVMMVEKGEQRYGTQLIKKDNYWILKPLESKTKVDEYRAEVGLNPIRKYLDECRPKLDGEAYIDEEERNSLTS